MDLQEILRLHQKWLNGEDGGQRADLSGTDLRRANLSGTDSESVLGYKIFSVQFQTSRNNEKLSYWEDLDVWTTGCFQGSLDDLKEKIEKTHENNEEIRKKYYKAIDFIRGDCMISRKVLEKNKVTTKLNRLLEDGEVLISHKELADILGVQTKSAITHLDAFKKYIDLGFYPQYSIIKPLLHYYIFKAWYGKKRTGLYPAF